MVDSFVKLLIFLIICLLIYGIIYIIGVGFKFPGHSRRRDSRDFLKNESRELEEKIAEEAKKRVHKRDQISSIAKQKPEQIASILKKWITKNKC